MIGINEPMPKNCEVCPFNNDGWLCNLLGVVFDEDRNFDTGKGRLPDCPLVDLSEYDDDLK